jgi:hypothetical protein
MKKLHTLDLNSAALHVWQAFCHWTIKADIKWSIHNYLGLILAGHLLVWQICSLNWDLWIKSFVGTLCTWLWWSNVKTLTTVSGVLGSNPAGVIFNIFSCWHPWETRFKIHSSFWDFKCRIWKWGMASSFWNHVIQISNRQVYFQDIYSQLWIVKIFTENIYFL